MTPPLPFPEPTMNRRDLALALPSTLALCLAIFAPLVTGCTAADASNDMDDEEVAEADQALNPPPPPPPASCQDIRSGNPNAGDGNYTLFIGQDSHKPWT